MDNIKGFIRTWNAFDHVTQLEDDVIRDFGPIGPTGGEIKSEERSLGKLLRHLGYPGIVSTTLYQILPAYQIPEPVPISSTFLSRLSSLVPLFKMSAIGAI
jgi:hypothetical protein